MSELLSSCGFGAKWKDGEERRGERDGKTGKLTLETKEEKCTKKRLPRKISGKGEGKCKQLMQP